MFKSVKVHFHFLSLLALCSSVWRITQRNGEFQWRMICVFIRRLSSIWTTRSWKIGWGGKGLVMREAFNLLLIMHLEEINVIEQWTTELIAPPWFIKRLGPWAKNKIRQIVFHQNNIFSCLSIFCYKLVSNSGLKQLKVSSPVVCSTMSQCISIYKTSLL